MIQNMSSRKVFGRKQKVPARIICMQLQLARSGHQIWKCGASAPRIALFFHTGKLEGSPRHWIAHVM